MFPRDSRTHRIRHGQQCSYRFRIDDLLIDIVRFCGARFCLIIRQQRIKRSRNHGIYFVHIINLLFVDFAMNEIICHQSRPHVLFERSFCDAFKSALFNDTGIAFASCCCWAVATTASVAVLIDAVVIAVRVDEHLTAAAQHFASDCDDADDRKAVRPRALATFGKLNMTPV